MSVLVSKYKGALEEYPSFPTDDTTLLIKDLEALKEWRNILCHCSWRPPDKNGKCTPFFIKRGSSKSGQDKKESNILQNEINIETIQQIRKKTVELACEVMNSVTIHGHKFPGTMDY